MYSSRSRGVLIRAMLTRRGPGGNRPRAGSARQGGGLELVGPERRVELDVAVEVLAAHAPVLRAQHRPDLEPVFPVQENRYLRDPLRVGLLHRAPQDVTRPVAGGANLLHP